MISYTPTSRLVSARRFAKGRSKPFRQRGYVLVLTIAVLAVMLLGATYMGRRISLARDMAAAEKQRTLEELALVSARSKVLFLLAYVPRTKFGLGASPDSAVVLDGRAYRIGKDVIVTLQDARGLISLNSAALEGAGRIWMERLISSYGLEPNVAASLTDEVLDYRDGDDLRRLNGAELDDYLEAEMSGQIRNAFFLTPLELQRVKSFGGVAEFWEDDPLSDHLSTQRASLFNPNTANWRALVAATGMSEEMARNLVQSRRSGRVLDVSGMAFAGVLNNPFGQGASIVLYPGETIIVTLRYAGSPSGIRMSVKHTPASESFPWLVQYSYKVSLPGKWAPIDDIPSLPEPDLLRDSGTPYQVELPF